MTRRTAHHDSDMFAIFRKARPGEGQQAWCVHLSRGGRSIQTTFSDRTYGSEAAALHVARAYRDAVLEVVPPMTRRDLRMLVRASHPEGSALTGVSHIPESPGRPEKWIARIEVALTGAERTARLADVTRPPPARMRRMIVRSFRVDEWGYDGAREAAEEERIRMVIAVENGEDPALGSDAAKRLHRRLGGKGAGKAEASD